MRVFIAVAVVVVVVIVIVGVVVVNAFDVIQNHVSPKMAPNGETLADCGQINSVCFLHGNNILNEYSCQLSSFQFAFSADVGMLQAQDKIRDNLTRAKL